jgi:predicted O-methyltransferase YrrM
MSAPSLLAPLTPQDLVALLCQSRRPGHASAWHGHVAFAHWLMLAARPRLVVELGTEHGVSYASFCHAVAALGLRTRCFAIDTWQGDALTGRYGEGVYADLKRFNDTYYSAFSTLLRGTFDAALGKFEDRSIDLLHIDGEHAYERVRHDFETWLSKLSDQAVVLFHDIAVRRPGYGVWQLWEELRGRYPSFTFEHSSGLGVLAVGSVPPAPVAALCAVADTAQIERVRECIARFSELAQSSALRELELAQLRTRPPLL